jgi:hypothetical protein
MGVTLFRTKCRTAWRRAGLFSGPLRLAPAAHALHIAPRAGPLLLTALLALWPTLTHAGPVVVARAGSFPGTLDADQVRALFLGETSHLGKTRVTLVLRHGDDPLEGRFIDQVLQLPASRFDSHWIRMVFRGEAAPPVDVGSDAELLARVVATPGALGIMTAEEARRHPELVTVFTVPDGR